MTNESVPGVIHARRGPQPVQVRLIGDDQAVRALVAALDQAAVCGPVSYRSTRYGGGVRAYLSIVVPVPGAGHQGEGD